MSNPITAIQKYYEETVEQLKKCTWPSVGELYESTVVVVSFMILLTVFVLVVDWVCATAVRFITSGF
ncbi:MAG: preprotein translocase subunit SecE [Victivallales bacterium]|nr:preprotein translocase subunit SecE [Victivallales bacterium]